MHCSTHLKKKKFNPTPTKIIKLTLFFFHSFILSPCHHPSQHLSSQFSQALISFTHQALISLIKLSTPSSSQPSPRPRRPSHPSPCRLSSSHLSHLPAHAVAVPSQPTSLPSRAIPAHTVVVPAHASAHAVPADPL